MMKKFVGGRIFKTGLSVLVTAIILETLNWPAMFAVSPPLSPLSLLLRIPLRKLLFVSGISHWCCICGYLYILFWGQSHFLYLGFPFHNYFLYQTEITRWSACRHFNRCCDDHNRTR